MHNGELVQVKTGPRAGSVGAVTLNPSNPTMVKVALWDGVIATMVDNVTPVETPAA